LLRSRLARRLAKLLFLAPSAVFGQAARDTTRTDTTAQKLKTVTVSGARAVGTVGGSSAVVLKPAELRLTPAPLLDQALRESPFVHVRLNSRGEMELSIRGSDSRQAAVLLDGVPITLGWDHRTDPSVIPIAGSDRLTIVRGLGSLLNGPNTLGGTIEVGHDPFARIGGHVTAGLGVDENGATVANVSGGRVAPVAGGALSIRGGMAHRQREGVTLPDGVLDPTSVNGLRTNTDLRELDGFASIRWSSLLGLSIGLTVSAMDAEKGVPPEEHIAAPRLWRYPYHRRAIAALSASTGTLATPLGYGSFDVSAGYNGGRVKIESYSARDYATVNGVELGDERTTTVRAILKHSAGPASVRAGLTLADVQYEESLLPADPVDYRQKMRSTGIEVESPIGHRTNIAAGFVMDHTTTPETGGRLEDAEPFDANGWRAGLTHDLNDQWRLHASASERSRFPSLRELYSGALNRFTPNPDLQPETLLGLEGGVSMERRSGSVPRVGFTVIGFRHRLEDAVVRITLSNPTRFMRVNRDRIDSRGVELLGGFGFGQDPERSVTLNGDATLQNIAIFDQTANDTERHAENNPEVRGRVELGLPLPWQVRGFATARHTGTQYCLNGETGNEMTLKSATTTDFAVERRFAVRDNGPFRWLRAVLALDNAGNSAVYDQCGLPQPGRTLRMMMTIG
jgi:iron complex outermembrane receptor protein